MQTKTNNFFFRINFKHISSLNVKIINCTYVRTRLINKKFFTVIKYTNYTLYNDGLRVIKIYF